MSGHGQARGRRAGGTPPSAVQEETQTNETVPRRAAFVAFASFLRLLLFFSHSLSASPAVEAEQECRAVTALAFWVEKV